MKKKITTLPKEFKKYFWDVDFKWVSTRPLDRFTLERVMNFGNLKALKWLLHTVPKSTILKVVESSRQLDKKTINFWKIIYG
jgi:hypothetical protein